MALIACIFSITTSLNPKKVPAIMPQLADRLADIVQGKVRRGLLNTGENVGRPAPRKLLDRADVQIPVMEKPLEGRHFARQKPAILADAVATHGRGSGHRVLRQEIQRPHLRFLGGHPAVTNPLQQAGAAVRGAVPFIHRTKHGIVLVNRNHRPLRQWAEKRVGDDRRDFDDAISLGVQARHLEVDPDQIVGFQGVTRQRSGQDFQTRYRDVRRHPGRSIVSDSSKG
jgi:hypothetical protein